MGKSACRGLRRDRIRTLQDFFALCVTIDIHGTLLTMSTAERSLFSSDLVTGIVVELKGRAFLFQFTVENIPTGCHLKEGTKAGKGESFAVEEAGYLLYLFKFEIAKYPVICHGMTFGLYEAPFLIISDSFL